MRRGRSLWLWSAVLISVLPLGLALILIYSWLPADGATGNLESFRSTGFDAQWLLERREGGLQAGDVIVRAGGYTLAEWLAGAPRGPEWTNGGVVPYEVLRDGQIVELQIRLAPSPCALLWLAGRCSFWYPWLASPSAPLSLSNGHASWLPGC